MPSPGPPDRQPELSSGGWRAGPLRRAPESPFTGTELAGLRDYWTAYEASRSEIDEEVREALRDDIELGPLVDAIEADVPLTDQASTRRAILDGQWPAYWAELRRQANIYSRSSLSLGAWFVAISAFRKVMCTRLIDTYSSTPARLARCMDAVNELVDRGLTVIVSAYLAVDRELLGKERRARVEAELSSRNGAHRELNAGGLSDLGDDGQDERPPARASKQKPRQRLVDRSLPDGPVGVGRKTALHLDEVVTRFVE